ncbi:hypothetical protein ACFWJ4_13725 [Kitasatospora sp. NPDC127067]|uniref:hypothetical protein n=1 Tax=Kitasatospora sp. NPDC127067 TaxID=3347126 RepID=UPI0036643F3E
MAPNLTARPVAPGTAASPALLQPARNNTYGHLTVEDARRTLEAAGWFTGREVRL